MYTKHFCAFGTNMRTMVICYVMELQLLCQQFIVLVKIVTYTVVCFQKAFHTPMFNC